MESIQAPRRDHLAGVGVSIFALLFTLSACSSGEPEREYATPKSLCGITVDPEELTDFLPPGKKVSTTATSSPPKATRCTVSVDGKKIIYITQEWWNDMSVLEFAQGMTLDELDGRTDDGRFAYTGNQAFGKTEDCRKKSEGDQVLYTAIQATGSKHKNADAMKKMIANYTAAVEKSNACR
jgi:hypothetical protein